MIQVAEQVGVDFSGWQERVSGADENPRNSNTGVVITNSAECALIDWLSFTVPAGLNKETVTKERTVTSWRTVHRAPGVSEGVEVVKKLDDSHVVVEEMGVIAADLAFALAGESDVPALSHGSLGYTHGYRLPGGGSVLYNPDRVDMGVHVSLPSGALALIPHTPQELIALVLGAGGKFTRLDVALDSRETHISTVEAAIRRGDLVSRSEQRTYQGSFVNDSFTIYIGARSSDRFVRIYNKAQEQKLTDGSIWTRCEVEFKKHQAQLAATYILQGADLRSLVFSAIDFRDRQADKNTSRCPQLDWWAAWVGAVERVSFAREAITKTIRRSYDWLVRQCAPTIAFLDEAFGKNPKWFFKMCEDSRNRVPAARLKEIVAMPAAMRMQMAGLAPL